MAPACLAHSISEPTDAGRAALIDTAACRRPLQRMRQTQQGDLSMSFVQQLDWDRTEIELPHNS